jgi:hypothetical protein
MFIDTATKLKNWRSLTFSLAITLFQCPMIYARDNQTETPSPWIVAARLIRNGEESASGIYLNPGLVVTAAHLTAGWTGAELIVHIAGRAFPATLVRQGEFTDVDLALFSVDQQKLPEAVRRIQTFLCQASPSPGNSVIIVDYAGATRSRIISPEIVPVPLRSKFSSLIADVATTGNSGSGVFDPNHKYLLGIMSRKFFKDGRDIAKYFVPASEIRDFLPVELRGQVLMK